MGLESVSFVDDLTVTNPTASDVRSEGDDHLRNIKTALKATFPGLAGRAWREQVKSSGYTVLATDNMSVIQASAAITLTLTAAATLGSGHFFFADAKGGAITLDGNSSETVNGNATLLLPQGWMALVFCDGAESIVFLAPRASGITAAAVVGDFLSMISALTEDTTPDSTADYVVTLDATDGKAKKVLLTAAASGFSTGDVKLTLKTVADSGWVLMNDTTIGNAASGGTGRANADTVNLFTLLWTNTADAQCAVSSGRGGSAAADYAANKTLALPKSLGRALATYGAGSGLTSRVLALTTGVETHPLTIGELAAHTHTGVVGSAGGQNIGSASPPAVQISGISDATGSGTAHQNMQPTLFLNCMIKL